MCGNPIYTEFMSDSSLLRMVVIILLNHQHTLFYRGIWVIGACREKLRGQRHVRPASLACLAFICSPSRFVAPGPGCSHVRPRRALQPVCKRVLQQVHGHLPQNCNHLQLERR